MKIKTLLTHIMLALTISVSGQSITLTFTAIDDTTYTQLDSIKVMNRIQDCETTLSWPDTVLVLTPPQGISETIGDVEDFQVFQNYPNPVTDQTTVTLYVPNKDKVGIIMTDILGRMIIQTERVLDRGKHTFLFTPGSGNLYFFNAQWQGYSSSIKILSAADGLDRAGSLEYISGQFSPQIKAVEAVQDFFFTLGDSLLYIGYINTLQSGILDAPEASDTCTFQFATNIPCPGTPTVTYEGQVYNTIQIFSQCWLKENLNVGTMIQGTEEMTDNGIMEKYCYNNIPDSCTKYGGLFQWDEMMQYSTQPSIQGICPIGWHIPKDEEWKILGGSVDSKYGIGDTIWDQMGYLNFNAADNLKTTSGWYGSWNGTDLYGFSALPGGMRTHESDFIHIGVSGSWFTYSEVSLDLVWGFHFHGGPASWWHYYKTRGFSVRCIRD